MNLDGPKHPSYEEDCEVLLPKEFGLWKQDSEGPQRLFTEIETAVTEVYRVSLEISPKSGRIEIFEVQLLTAEKQNLIGTFPNFQVSKMSEALSDTLMDTLFRDQAGEKLTHEMRIGRAVTHLLFHANLSEFDFNEVIINARLRANLILEIIRDFSFCKNIPLKTAKLIIDYLPECKPRGTIAVIASSLVSNAEKIGENLKPEFYSSLFETLTSLKLTKLMISLCWTGGGASKDPLGEAKDLSFDVGKLLIDGVLSRSLFERKIMLCSLTMRLGSFEKAARPKIAEYLSNVLLESNSSEVIVDILNSFYEHPGLTRSDLIGLNPKIVSSIITEAEDPEILTILSNLDLFEGIDCTDIAFDLIKRGKFGLISQTLSYFRELPWSIATTLLEEGNTSSVLDNLGSFIKNVHEVTTLLGKVILKGAIDNIVLRLNELPERALFPLEAKFHFLAYRKDVGIGDIVLYSAYLALKESRDEIALTLFIADLANLRKSLISSEIQEPNLIKHRYYKPVVRSVYPLRSDYTSFENNECCPDRSSDISQFKIKGSYRIDLSEGVGMALKEKEVANHQFLDRLDTTILSARTRFLQQEDDKKLRLKILEREVDELSKSLPPFLKTPEEKIVGLFLEALIGKGRLEDAKAWVIAYQFAQTENLHRFMADTHDRAIASRNPEYANLLGLREYFADVLQNTISQIVKRAFENDSLSRLLPRYFKILEDRTFETYVQEKLHKYQVQKLGISPVLLTTLIEVLKASQASNSDPQRKFEIVQRIIEREQRKIANLIRDLTGEVKDPANVHLADFDLKEILENAKSSSMVTSENRLLERCVETFFWNIFREDIAFIDNEIGKYQPITSGKLKVEVLEGYITKNHASAHARGTSGLCVAGDNPTLESPNMLSQWNLPNYFQMVLKDPKRDRCEGLVLLHYYNEVGKKILTASFNPTSTYLLKVNEGELFKGLLEKLVEFAKDNDIDVIACSTREEIRTNRSGGEFELALKQAIHHLNKRISLSSDRPFSFEPRYVQRVLDVLWEKN